MPQVKGDRLYVNLNASQVRRRLKGVGYGVRKVQSAGDGQSVIIHTATGRHLDELKLVFADVLPKPKVETEAAEDDLPQHDDTPSPGSLREPPSPEGRWI